MDDNRRKILIGVIAAVIIILIALLLWWLLARQKPASPSPAASNQPSAQVVIPEPAPVTSATAARIQAEAAYPLGLKQTAMTFAERYASYSTDEPGKSIRDLRPMMTDAYAATFKFAPPANTSAVFTGYSAVGLVFTLLKADSVSAQMTVSLQITQTVGAGDVQRNYYKTLILDANKIGSEWKINGAKWQQ